MDHQEAFSSILMNEDNKVTYSPTTMAVGSRFYDFHPIKFNSLLKEENLIKNRGGGNSMQNGIEYAHVLDKKLDTLVNVFEDVDDPSITSMNVSENVTEGRAHIGVLQANPDAISEIETNPETGEEETFAFAKSAWRKPQIYVDEDYFGNFHIEKKMNIATEVADDDYTDDYDWLPCTCNSGWDDMDLHDTRYHSARGFFDCTAYPTPYCKS
jgi:hypothetical protein